MEEEPSESPASDRSLRNIQRSKFVTKMMESWNINAKEFKRSREKKHSAKSSRRKRKKGMDFRDLKDK